MAPASEIIVRVRRAAQKRILFLPHALERMSSPDRMISRHEVRSVGIMECYYCNGTLAHGTTSYAITRRGYHLIIDDVPAWVCQQCGEALFDEEVVDLIQEMVREMDVRMERLEAVRV